MERLQQRGAEMLCTSAWLISAESSSKKLSDGLVDLANEPGDHLWVIEAGYDYHGHGRDRADVRTPNIMALMELVPHPKN